jgi:hypothetical protein
MSAVAAMRQNLAVNATSRALTADLAIPAWSKTPFMGYGAKHATPRRSSRFPQ